MLYSYFILIIYIIKNKRKIDKKIILINILFWQLIRFFLQRKNMVNKSTKNYKR